MAAMIEARGLSKRFGSRVVLEDLEFSVKRGARLALLGLNGAGKTTLLRCLMGVLSFEGSIEIAGVHRPSLPFQRVADAGRTGKRVARDAGSRHQPVDGLEDEGNETSLVPDVPHERSFRRPAAASTSGRSPADTASAPG